MLHFTQSRYSSPLAADIANAALRGAKFGIFLLERSCESCLIQHHLEPTYCKARMLDKANILEIYYSFSLILEQLEAINEKFNFTSWNSQIFGFLSSSEIV